MFMLPMKKKKETRLPRSGAQVGKQRTRRPTPMRTIMRHEQPLMQAFIDHEHAWELEAISEILDAFPEAR